MEFSHTSVLLQEAVDGLNIKPEGVYVDGTLGGGGHSFEIRKRLSSGRLIGIDRDEEAIEAAKQRLSVYTTGVDIVHTNYADIPEVIKRFGLEGVDGILLDLGVSSHQFDDSERGFSYRDENARLDMRMDRSESTDACEILNTYSKEELIRILRDYGEERFAGRIASNIVAEREKERIETVGRLNAIIDRSIPKGSRTGNIHPEKRTYQALRIATNRELDILNDNLMRLTDCLLPKGRIAIITFHSLEDRIVKNIFKTMESPCVCPKDFPVCVCGRVSKGKVITRHPIVPEGSELEVNPRARSAKLRIFEHC